MPDLVAYLAASIDKNEATFEPAALSELSRLELRGNIRELRRWVERVLAASGGAATVTVAHVKEAIRLAGGPSRETLDINIAGKTAEQIEDEAFLKLCAFHGGDANVAGKALGFGETKIIKMKKRLLKK